GRPGPLRTFAAAPVAARSVKAPMSMTPTTLFWRCRRAPASPERAGPRSGFATIKLVSVSNIIASPEPFGATDRQQDLREVGAGRGAPRSAGPPPGRRGAAVSAGRPDFPVGAPAGRLAKEGGGIPPPGRGTERGHLWPPVVRPPTGALWGGLHTRGFPAMPAL